MNSPLGRVMALCLTTVAAFAQNPRTFTNQYSFGDSLSDSGNLFAATSAMGAPNPPPPYFQGRFSNGPVFTELLGNNLALAAVAPAAVRSSLNFAFGGAMAAGTATLPPSLGVQVGMFQQRGITPQRTDLFTVLAGPNDLIPVLTAATTPTNPAALDVAGATAAQAVATNLQALVGLGAKNIVVAGMPNLGATPRSLATGGPGGAGATFGLRATTAFNVNLRSRLQAISTAAPDVNLTYVDLQSVLDRIVLDYRLLGYANANAYYLAPAGQGGAQGDPNSYVFWDDIHPTARTHALLAAVVTEALNPERPLGFNATLGSAALALDHLGSDALDARLAQLVTTDRPARQAQAYASFNYAGANRPADAWRPKFDYDAQVVTAGLDARVAERCFVGGAVDFGRLNADVGGGRGRFKVEDAGGRLYGMWRSGPFAMTFDGGYGTVTVKGIQRTTALGGIAARGKTSGDRWNVGTRAAYALAFPAGSLRPWVGLRAARVSLDRYTEKDVPALAMEFEGQDARSTSGAAGFDATCKVPIGSHGARLDLRAAWHGELGSRNRTVTGRLADNFTRPTAIAVEDGDGDGVELGGALTILLTKSWSGSLGYAADIRNHGKLANRGNVSVQTGF